MQYSEKLAALDGVNLPPKLVVEAYPSLDEMHHTAYRRASQTSRRVIHGTAQKQGNRLQFVGSMPLDVLLELTKTRRSKKKSGVGTVTSKDHSNRPREDSHQRKLKEYLLETACQGLPFILPAFTLNYGVHNPHDDDDGHDMTIMLYSEVPGDTEATNWTAVLVVSPRIVLDITDGAHRRNTFKNSEQKVNAKGKLVRDGSPGILDDDSVPEEYKQALRANAFDVKIVFEPSLTQAFQDFADCSKSKPIAKSLIQVYDLRDQWNKRAKELITNIGFLSAYVNATASNVNLSAGSLHIWSVTAIRSFVTQVTDGLGKAEDTQRVYTATKGAEEFLEAVIRHIPALTTLADAIGNDGNPAGTDAETNAPMLRSQRGGSVLMRGAAMSIFARAFVFAIQNRLDFDTVAQRLGQIDWNLLTIERPDKEHGGKDGGPISDEEFSKRVLENRNHLWQKLIVVGHGRYKTSSSGRDIDGVWKDAILPRHFSDLVPQVDLAAE